jgi:hypothetical protein
MMRGFPVTLAAGVIAVSALAAGSANAFWMLRAA